MLVVTSNIKMIDKTEQYSPDKSHKLTFFDFDEPRMGMSICKFSLTDMQANQTIKFNPLLAIGIGQLTLSWSENQNYFSLPLVNPTENFFIYNIADRQFSSIHFANCWVLTGHCNNDKIEIEYEDNQIPERIEHNKYPTKEFSKPVNLQFKFSELQWTDIKLLENFNELNKNATIHDLKPIDNGWRQFKGQLPQTTEVLVWELNEFAKYGDSQSIEWFDEIQAKRKDINYWVNASYYLGQRNRK
jgi:hypothetical protein